MKSSFLDSLTTGAQNNEFFQSFKENIFDRITSPLYGAFIVSWCIANWKVLYVTFFLSEASLKGITKLEYIENLYPDLFTYLGYLYIFPIVSTGIIIWGVSWLGDLAFYESLEHKRDREIKKQRVELEILEKIEKRVVLEKEIVETETDVIKQKEENIEKQKEIQDSLPDEENWKNQYKNIKEVAAFSYMDPLKQMIYEGDGQVTFDNDEGEWLRPLNVDAIAFLDANGIIKKVGQNKYSLTPKGEFFMKEYVNENIPF